MIIGIGTDIIEIDRVLLAVKRNKKFLEKMFTKREIEYFEKKNLKGETIAGNFAAKEAISKALGTGIRGFSFNDIEILRDDLGKPVAKLNNNIEKLLNLKKYSINISISHNKSAAIAFAVIEER